MHSRSPLSIAFLHRWKSVPHFTLPGSLRRLEQLACTVWTPLRPTGTGSTRSRTHNTPRLQALKRQLIYNIMAVKSRQQNYWQTAISCRMQSARRSLCREMKIYESYRPICTMPSANRLYRQ